MKSSIKIIAVTWLFILVLFGASCKTGEDSAREYMRMEKKMAREEDKSYEAAKKEHMKIQSKATRKMMRDSHKKAKKLNKSKVR